MADHDLRDWIDSRLSGDEGQRPAQPRIDEAEPFDADAIEAAALADLGHPGLGDEDDDVDPAEPDGGSGDPDHVRTGADVVAMAFAREDELRANGWDGAAEFLLHAASDAHWWMEAARDMGVPAEARPQQQDLEAVGLGIHAIAAGIPGARIVSDPLFSRRPRSARRLW